MTTLLEHDGGAIAFGLENVVPSDLSMSLSGSGAAAWYSPQVYLHTPYATKAYWPASQEAPWIEELAGRFQKLRSLDRGWDGHSASPIDADILIQAWRWLRKLSRAIRVPPSVVPTIAGGLAFEWHRPGMDLEIELSPAGQYVSYEDSKGNEIDDRPLVAHVETVARALSDLR